MFQQQMVQCLKHVEHIILFFKKEDLVDDLELVALVELEVSERNMIKL